MKQAIKPISMAAILASALVLLFQNCSDPLGSDTKQSSFTENLPFAYDTTLDTIGYMSCAGGDTAANPQAIWTFRAGAFAANNGIRLKQGFLDLTRNFSSAQRAEALSQSTQNSNAVLQLAIRPAMQLQQILTSSGSSGQAGEDFGSIIGPLDDSQIASRLASVDLSNPPRLNYFSGISGLSGRTVEGGIRFTKDEGEANSVRGYLAGSALLTATYSADAMPNKDARGPGGLADGVAYGRGYKLQFNYPPGETVARAISSVQEIDLETGRGASDATGWVCPAELQFRIARECTECGCNTDSGNPALLAQVRRVLKVEHWYVDLANKCVKQKTSSQQCYPSGSTGNYHYVSICTRT